MKLITEYAIKAFNEGSDNYGETATGEVVDLSWIVLLQCYHVTVKLAEKDGRHTTAGIGFYPRDNKFDVVSGHVVFEIDNSPELEAELALAQVEEY